MKGMLRTITKEELETAITNHRHWIAEDCKGWEGMRADLSDTDLHNADLSWTLLKGANLRGADLQKVNLQRAYLQYANLRGADLRFADLRDAFLYGANLRGADLHGADLRGVDLQDADLRGTNLSHANLFHADLRNAHLRDVDLHGADLREANLANALLAKADLTDAKLPEGEEYRMGTVLASPITGYKMTREGVIITAEIPAGATVFCINGGKCRTDRARIVDMGGHDTLHSTYNQDFAYHEGQEIEISDFDPHYNIECAPGFHFFRTREEAENYGA